MKKKYRVYIEFYDSTSMTFESADRRPSLYCRIVRVSCCDSIYYYKREDIKLLKVTTI